MLRSYNLLITIDPGLLDSFHMGPHLPLDAAYVDWLEPSRSVVAAIQTLSYPREIVM